MEQIITSERDGAGDADGVHVYEPIINPDIV